MGFFSNGTTGAVNDDLYILIEINTDDIIKSNAMTYEMLWKYITKRYEEQPLKYFNDSDRLKVIHLKSGVVKTLRLALEAI